MFEKKQLENQTRLLSSEWILVGSLVLLMVSLAIVGTINASRSSSVLEENPLPPHELCTVVISGEVSKPGAFQVSPGTSLKKIVRKSAPTPFADLKKIDLEQQVEESMHIHIEKLTEITIAIQGLYSDPVERTIPAGTKVCHLKNFIQDDLKPFEDFLKSRRVLKDREEISLIPPRVLEEGG